MNERYQWRISEMCINEDKCCVMHFYCIFLNPPVCAFIETMDDPKYIPDSQIEVNVKGSDGSDGPDVRPGGQTYNPPVPKSPTDPKPEITITLDKQPVYLEKVNLPPTTNVATVTILVPVGETQQTTTPGTNPTNLVPVVENVPVGPNGDVSLPPLLKVSKIVIVPESVKPTPSGQTPDNYVIEVNVHACIEGRYLTLPLTTTQ